MNKVVYKLSEIARLINGTIYGNKEMEISGAKSINVAKESDITFAVPPHMQETETSKAGCIIIGLEEKELSRTYIKTSNPRLAFAKLLELFYGYKKPEAKISPNANIACTVKIGTNVTIMANVTIDEEATIESNTVLYPGVYIGKKAFVGNNCILFSNVSIYYNCYIGENCIIHSGAVIGSDGFGFVSEKGTHYKIPQVGNCIIENNVEIGANSTIDRATTGSTIIGKGTKIDNLVHIGHNVKLGEGCLVVAFSGLSGSTIVGKNVIFGGQSGTTGHLTIGDNCIFAARSGINNNVEKNSIMAGYPLKPFKQWLKDMVSFNKISEITSKVKKIEKKLESLLIEREKNNK